MVRLFRIQIATFTIVRIIAQLPELSYQYESDLFLLTLTYQFSNIELMILSIFIDYDFSCYMCGVPYLGYTHLFPIQIRSVIPI